MSATKEPVCCRLQDLRMRLERLKESWETSNAPPTQKPISRWAGFQHDWREGWLKIETMLREIELRLGHRQRGRLWDVSQPAILRFPPLGEGAVSIGPV